MAATIFTAKKCSEGAIRRSPLLWHFHGWIDSNFIFLKENRRGFRACLRTIFKSVTMQKTKIFSVRNFFEGNNFTK